MNWQSLSKWFVVVLILVVAVYDLTALAIGGNAATISRVVGINGSFDSPLIPYGIGFVMGHLFWPQSKQLERDVDKS